jgi:hypothetical protein
VLGVALLLVVGVGKVLGGGGDGKDDGVQATAVSGSPTATNKPQAGAPTSKKTKKPRKPKKTVAPLAQPSGPCAESDVVVTPKVTGARAGGDVAIRLLITTKVSEACTFDVSPHSVVLKLTSGSDKIWSSQQCQSAIPTANAIARRTVPGKVILTWNAHRSNDECSKAADWALPGYYHAEAAALGSDPTDVQFQLSRPQAPTITPKPKIMKVKS